MEGTPTIDGVRKAFASHHDLAVAKEIQHLLQEWAAGSGAKEEAAAAQIAELEEQVQDAQAQAQRAEPAEEHERRVAELTQEEQRAQDAVHATLSSMQGKEDSRQAMRSLEQQLRRSARRLNAVSDDDEPRCRYHLSLYAHISNIAWDRVDEECVAGVVSDLAGHRMQCFSLDKTALTQFEVVNQVWAAVA